MKFVILAILFLANASCSSKNPERKLTVLDPEVERKIIQHMQPVERSR